MSTFLREADERNPNEKERMGTTQKHVDFIHSRGIRIIIAWVKVLSVRKTGQYNATETDRIEHPRIIVK